MPAIILRGDRVKAMNRRHPWIFSKAIKKVVDNPQLGETIDVLDPDGKWLARAAYSPHSQIRARVWTFNEQEQVDQAFFEQKIDRALAIRQRIISNGDLTGYRLFAAESDGLPGVTVDVFDTIASSPTAGLFQ